MSNNPAADHPKTLTITNNVGWILDVIVSDRGLEIAVTNNDAFPEGVQIGLTDQDKITILEFLAEA